jgi:nucleoside-diphosphate-sugar epimerase
MSTVLIIGASRGIGLETVKLALKAGHSVRAMARSASAIRLRDPKLKKLDGDALDQPTMERVLAGIDAVIQTLGVSPSPELIFGGTRLSSVATRVLVNAMEASAVKRLIRVTGFGAGDSRGRGGLLYAHSAEAADQRTAPTSPRLPSGRPTTALRHATAPRAPHAAIDCTGRAAISARS